MSVRPREVTDLGKAQRLDVEEVVLLSGVGSGMDLFAKAAAAVGGVGGSEGGGDEERWIDRKREHDRSLL